MAKRFNYLKIAIMCLLIAFLMPTSLTSQELDIKSNILTSASSYNFPKVLESNLVLLLIVFLLFLTVIWRNYVLRAAKQRLEKEVSRRKQVEEQLRRNKERFDLAVDGTKDGLWDWNLETNEAYYSDQFARMLGYEPEELPYTSAAWSDQLHPDDREKAFARLQAYLDGKTEEYESTFRMRTKSGGYRWIRGTWPLRARKRQTDTHGRVQYRHQ